MRVAYFDAIGGAAGDMFIGSLLDAGLDFELLESELRKLPLEGYRLERKTVVKHHIQATQFLVHVQGEDGHRHNHHNETEPGRSLRDIRDLIARSDLTGQVCARALDIFDRLGRAEAKVHGMSIDDVHFHEVGAIDSIVDIVGAAIGIDFLGIDAAFCSPLPTGSGTVITQHGIYPVPAPATLAIAAEAGALLVPGSASLEQVTPTGAAILTTFADFRQPEMSIEAVGYGSGVADLAVPNVLRVWIGESSQESNERLSVLETNLDDMDPRLYPPLVDELLANGALDALLVPVIMKKGRPGTKIEVLARPEDERRLRDVLLRGSTTLGVRSHVVDRLAAKREIVQVETPHGFVAVKVKSLEGKPVGAVPEFEDCRRLAENLSLPLTEVYRSAVAAALRHLQERTGD